MKKYLILSFLLLSNFFSLIAQEKNTITSFSPEGVVKNIKQVKVSFSSQMVPFGNPRVKTDQFEINCPIEGKARWIDEKTFVYEFANNLEAGIQCKFQLKPEVKTLSGKDISGNKTFSFSTGGPAILYTNPYEGNNIDEDQIFILTLDADVKESSLENKLAFEIEGVKDRVAAQVIKPSDAQEILKSEFGERYKTDKLLLIKSKLRFPNKAKVSLIWGKGIESKSGVKTDEDRVLTYSARPPFTAEFSCDRENKNAGCLPITNLYVNFTSPISKSDAKKATLEGNGRKWNAKISGSNEEEDGTTYGIYFEGPFPEETKFKISIPESIKDDSGRKLANANKFPLEVKTDKYPPLAKFSGSFGIIELEAEPLLPVTLRNLEKDVKAKVLKMTGEGGNFFSNLFGKKIKITPDNILIWLKKVSKAEREKSIFAGEVNTNSFNIPKPNGEKAFEVVGIPLKEPGFFVVELESEKLGNSLLEKKGKMYVPTSALVTNMAVHFQWGRESSLVWVTSLSKGEPISGAKISIRDCKNNLVAEGNTDTSGIWKLAGISQSKIPNCSYGQYDNGLLVIAEKDKDLSFVHSSWDNGIENWRFNLYGYSPEENTIAHTVLDRTLLRAGETVHMKHILRSHSTQGLSLASSNLLPTRMKISHVGSDQEYNVNLKWTGGFSEAEWKIPKQAKLGSYAISLLKGDKTYYTGEFRVEEFRVPLMKAIIKGPSEKLVKPKSFSVDLFVNYLSGGPAGGMAVKLKSWFRDTAPPEVDGYEDYIFANGRLKEGTRKLSSTRNYSEDEVEDLETTSSGNNAQIKTQELSLDKLGYAKTEIKDLPIKDNPQEVVTELEYRDPVGEIQTVSNVFPIYPGRYLVGLKSESWSSSKDGVKIFAAVVDQNGKPKAGVDVNIDLLGRKTITNRKRLVGGFYSYDSVEEVRKHITFCKGKTDAKGLLICKKESPVTGDVIFQASIEDSAGNDVFAYKEVYISGKDSWFNVSDHDRMDVIPDKKSYEPGETAKFQIRMPFKTATALISVNREGIVDYFVKEIQSSSPNIEVPIKSNYAPNVFISVLAVRGRVGEIKPTALVDLGRPSYRFGISPIKVGWKGYELKVNVKTDRPVFKVREKATVTIDVKTANGSKLPDNGDIALVAVDEGLLELMPNNTWELLRAMMNERGLTVNTSTAQMQVVGRRHYGLKALPPGGGGGKDSSRELFDTLLLWKGSVKLNSSGQAEVVVPLNDSLTRFKIVAIAMAGDKYFGTGSTSIRTTQDLMLLPGLPQLAREGDTFNPSFTVRNATEKPMKVDVSGTISGVSEKLET
ncbi:MAG TPA: MG2 domain-containing protein, partial [Leptospiraceae bacterium]|nr:MG2 domain-containing protein [Leptospiraceae bacterium]